MARKIEDILNEIIAAKNAQPALTALTSSSATAIWRLWAYVQAVCIWSLEQLFDEHRSGVNYLIAQEKPHTLKWYATMSLRFQFGFSLAQDETYFNNGAATEAQIAASKVVKYAAVSEVPKGLRIKVAGESGGDLTALGNAELAAFSAYMGRIKDAGVRLYIGTAAPDSLKQTLKIYYDPLILDNAGQRLDGTNNTPVQDAVAAYLKNLPFNGLFVHSKYIDALQQVEGVVIPEIVSSEARYGVLPYTPIVTEYLPDAGYLRIINPADLTLQFVPHAPIA